MKLRQGKSPVPGGDSSAGTAAAGEKAAGSHNVRLWFRNLPLNRKILLLICLIAFLPLGLVLTFSVAEIRKQSEEFAARAQELGDIAAAGEEASRTVIDAYFNDSTNGGTHPDVADAVRGMETGQVSGPIETEDGWYVVQRVSDYDESATEDNLEAMKAQAKMKHKGATRPIRRRWMRNSAQARMTSSTVVPMGPA